MRASRTGIFWGPESVKGRPPGIGDRHRVEVVISGLAPDISTGDVTGASGRKSFGIRTGTVLGTQRRQRNGQQDGITDDRLDVGLVAAQRVGVTRVPDGPLVSAARGRRGTGTGRQDLVHP